MSRHDDERTALFERLGLSPGAAAVAAAGRGPAPPSGDPFGDSVRRFRDLGMTESAARIAARGREHATDESARAAMREAALPHDGGLRDRLDRLDRLVATAPAGTFAEAPRRPVSIREVHGDADRRR